MTHCSRSKSTQSGQTILNLKPIDLSRAGAEIVIVVVGILIAFGLDSWWDSNKQQIWERSQLELLRDEAQSNMEHTKSVIEAHKGTAADIEVILAFATHQPAGEVVSLKNRAVTSLIKWRTSELSMGALDALFASGELGEISNPELRTSLTAWKAAALDAQEKENLARDFVERTLTPALSGEAYLAAAYAARPPYGNSEELESRNVEIRSSTRLRSLSAARLGHIRMAIYSQTNSLEALQEVVLLIERELSR